MRALSRLRRWFAAGLLLAGLGTADAASFDANALKTIPLADVIRLATIPYGALQFVDDDADRKVRLDEIAALDPDVQTLVWLSVLLNGLTEQTDANHNAPSHYIGSRRWDDRIRQALADAGLPGRAAVFATAAIGRGASKDGSSVETVDLGPAFGTKAAFAAAIEDYARRRVTAWCDAARARLSDDDRLHALLDMLGRLDTSKGLGDWPEPYRVLVLADVFDGEVGNGGIHQYFYNSSGDVAPETVTVMRVLGLPRHADTLVRAMGMFADPYPEDRETRLKAFAHDGFTAWDQRLEQLTDVVGFDAVRPAMVTYAKRRDLLPR